MVLIVKCHVLGVVLVFLCVVFSVWCLECLCFVFGDRAFGVWCLLCVACCLLFVDCLLFSC